MGYISVPSNLNGITGIASYYCVILKTMILRNAIKKIQNGVFLFSLKKKQNLVYFLKTQTNVFFLKKTKKTTGELFFFLKKNGFFSTLQHRPSLITPPRFKVPAHSDPVKCWNFRKADWKCTCLLTGESVERLPPPDTSDIERASQDFCESLLSAAKQCIPRGLEVEWLAQNFQHSSTRV